MFEQLVLAATSPAAAGNNSATAPTIGGLEKFDWFSIDARLTGATGGVLDVYLQRWVPKAGTAGEWFDWVHFAQAAAGAALARYSFDARMSETAVATVGAGTSPALAAAKMACAHPGHKVRLLLVAGASTSVGAAQQVIVTAFRS